MASRRENVVRVLLYVADDLDGRQYAMAGVLRQLAREVALLDEAEVEPGACRCGRLIVQPRTGRPRKWCTACSPVRKTPAKGHDPSEDVDARKGAA